MLILPDTLNLTAACRQPAQQSERVVGVEGSHAQTSTAEYLSFVVELLFKLKPGLHQLLSQLVLVLGPLFGDLQVTMETVNLVLMLGQSFQQWIDLLQTTQSS